MTDNKPLAVVTGASSGIGFQLAKVFADNGFDLLINAEDKGLDAAAEQLRAVGVHVQPIQTDLSTLLRRPCRVPSRLSTTPPMSFLQSFAQAVQNEPKDTDVTITALMPGPTDTNFFHRADMDDTKIGQGSKDDPAQVAKRGFDALMVGKNKIVAGSAKTKAQGVAGKVLPDKLKVAAHRQMAEPGSGE